MSRFSRLDVLNRMVETGLVPVFYEPDVEKARKVVAAVVEGGCPLVEFTNRGDHAWEVFSRLESHCRKELPGIALGVGSIVDAPTAALYINCGASFVVSPTLSADVARVCNRRKIAYVPGCGSAGDVGAAEELGCEIVKVFPAEEVGGPSFVKSILGPCPWTSFMPTGGVEPTRESLQAWFDSGVVCVGMGSRLITREAVQQEKWHDITERVARTLSLIRDIRGK